MVEPKLMLSENLKLSTSSTPNGDFDSSVEHSVSPKKDICNI